MLRSLHRHVRAAGLSPVRVPWVAGWRRLRGEPALESPPPGPPPPTLKQLGIDPQSTESVVVVADPTAAVVDGLLEELGDAAAAALAPAVLFGAAAGVELGRGLEAEEAAWARQLVDRLGGVDLLDHGPDLDDEDRTRIVLARELARGRPWTVLEHPLRDVAPERRRRATRVVDEARGDRGLIIVVPDRDSVRHFPYRVAHARRGNVNG